MLELVGGEKLLNGDSMSFVPERDSHAYKLKADSLENCIFARWFGEVSIWLGLAWTFGVDHLS